MNDPRIVEVIRQDMQRAMDEIAARKLKVAA